MPKTRFDYTVRKLSDIDEYVEETFSEELLEEESDSTSSISSIAQLIC
ncbi:MAG: hypothetical protein KAS93_05665 [Gammaproteobacteria bacterium]|nr:hypothetical protein [Gammaproteobacteria bacterium]